MRTENDRVNYQISRDTRYDNGCFDAMRMTQPEVHRRSDPNKWLQKTGFIPALCANSLNPYLKDNLRK